MLNAETIKAIAKTSETANTVLGACAKRERFREQINLKKFKYDLIKAGSKVVDEEFVDTFKKLEEAGVGSLVRGRNGNPDRFRWNFNLREVGSAAFSESNPELKAVKHKKRHLTIAKPATIPTPTKAVQSSTIQIVVNVPSTARVQDIEALISLMKDLV